jgi:hypothetical protein
MSHSWLYDRQDQLDGYRPFARIAYTLRCNVLPQDRDDIEMDVILKLREFSDKNGGHAKPAGLWFVGRCTVADYWRRKDRERGRSASLLEGNNGEVVADSNRWRYVAQERDADGQIDARAILDALPDRLKAVGERLLDGESLNSADRCYLSRQRARLVRDYDYGISDAEADRIKRLRQRGLSRCQIARALGRSHTTISKYLDKTVPA